MVPVMDAWAFSPGAPGFIDFISGLATGRRTGRLEIDLPGGGLARIDLVDGEVRAASCRGYAGMTVLCTCALFGVGSARLIPASGAIPDQFGIITAVLLDHLAESCARIRSGANRSDLPIDARTGLPMPKADTAPAEIAALGALRIRQRSGDEDGDAAAFADLVPAALRQTPLLVDPGGAHGWLPPPVGHMLGKCYLSGEVGQGATAVVYRALQVSLRIDVAVKVFRPDAPAGHLSVDEARLLARLNHPNIVRVLDCSDDQPWPHIVAEFVEGTTLSALIEQAGTLRPATAVPLLRQAAAGLAHAASQGIAHGDVKPGNLLVGRDGILKIADLGVARSHGSGVAHQVVGTPAYIAPEQVSDGAPPSAAGDVYALGITAFHMLAGAPPFLDDDPLRLMVRHVQDPVPSLRQACPGIEPRLDRLVQRMLAKQPAARPSWAEIAAELERLDRPPASGLPARAMTTISAALDQLRRLLGRE